MAELNQINEYYEALSRGFDSSDVVSFYNTDRAHNATIMRLMFEKSNAIDMYCGSLSVLRKSFYDDKIFSKDGKDVANLVKGWVTESFRNFVLKQDACLHIIFEYEDREFREKLLDKDAFCDAELDGKIKVFFLNERLSFKNQISHFCVTDSDIMRFEQDKETHSAICSIHDKESCENLRGNFHILESYADKI